MCLSLDVWSSVDRCRDDRKCILDLPCFSTAAAAAAAAGRKQRNTSQSRNVEDDTCFLLVNETQVETECVWETGN